MWILPSYKPHLFGLLAVRGMSEAGTQLRTIPPHFPLIAGEEVLEILTVFSISQRPPSISSTSLTLISLLPPFTILSSQARRSWRLWPRPPSPQAVRFTTPTESTAMLSWSRSMDLHWTGVADVARKCETPFLSLTPGTGSL